MKPHISNCASWIANSIARILYLARSRPVAGARRRTAKRPRKRRTTVLFEMP